MRDATRPSSGSFIARLARMDTAKAVKATAHQLACLIYALLTQGQEYVERGLEEFEARRRDRLLRSIPRKAKYLGLTVREDT